MLSFSSGDDDKQQNKTGVVVGLMHTRVAIKLRVFFYGIELCGKSNKLYTLTLRSAMPFEMIRELSHYTPNGTY